MARILALGALLALLTMTGCASRPTLAELEKEALQTGDWSEVDKRKRMDRKMGRHIPGDECPNGEALYCETKGEREDCSCVSVRLLR